MTVSTEARLELRNIWKIFEGNTEIHNKIIKNNLSRAEADAKYHVIVGVSDVSFQVQTGEIYCVMGLSGSGKSTLIRHINRLHEPTSGEILVNDVNILKLSSSELQQFRNQQIAMVFQNFALMPHRSVLDNIAMPLEIRGMSKNQRIEIAEQNLNLVELQGWGNKFAHELSGGMQQRVGLARALASNPNILLMDEPFSALDPLIRRQLQNQFMELAAKLKKTTIFITHDLDEAVRIGDRIAIMRDGRLIQEGTPKNIVMHPNDEYVAEFVAGISRLKVIHAGEIMTPLANFEKQHGKPADHLPRFTINEPLSKLIKQYIKINEPLIITDQDAIVGVVEYQNLLNAIIEGTDIDE